MTLADGPPSTTGGTTLICSSLSEPQPDRQAGGGRDQLEA